MALPKMVTPYYDLELPSDGSKIKYRPFTVKEHKILLMASESEDPKQVVNAISQILDACTEGFDYRTKPIFDLEYTFLQIRGKSIGETVKPSFPCPNMVKDGETEKRCGESIEIEIDLSQVGVRRQDGHTNQIDLGNGMTLVMKYPSFNVFEMRIESAFTEQMTTEQTFNLMAWCIDEVVDEEGVSHASDNIEEALEFLDSLNEQQMKSVSDFLNTMPSIYHEHEYKCPKCGFEGKFVLESMYDFFV